MLWLRAGGVCFIITKLPTGEPTVLQQASSRNERTQECVAVACLKHLFISLVFTHHSFTCMEQLVLGWLLIMLGVENHKRTKPRKPGRRVIEKPRHY